MSKNERARRKAEDLEDLGWEALGFPEPSRGESIWVAEEYFRKALAIYPDLADAYNGLGTVSYLQGRYAEAEAMYRTALEKARARLGTDRPRAFSWWGDVSTRPYMRARHNLGLVFWREGKYREAIREFEELLRRNRNDNQGIRYLIGGLWHLCGNVGKATSYYKTAGPMRFGGGDSHNEMNNGLALYQSHEYAEAVKYFRRAFFLNPYLPQVVLFHKVEPLKIWHGSNLAEPEYALDYWRDYSKLWTRRPRAATFLRLVYGDEIVRSELKEFLQIRERLFAEKEYRARSTLVDEEQRLTSLERLSATNPAIASGVISRFEAEI